MRALAGQVPGLIASVHGKVGCTESFVPHFYDAVCCAITTPRRNHINLIRHIVSIFAVAVIDNYAWELAQGSLYTGSLAWAIHGGTALLQVWETVS